MRLTFFPLEMTEFERNEHFQMCIKGIKNRIGNMGPLLGHKEIAHSKYIDIILLESLQITK